MPSQSWMPRSEYRLARGLRQVAVYTGQGWVSGIATKPTLLLFTGNFMGVVRRGPFASKTHGPQCLRQQNTSLSQHH